MTEEGGKRKVLGRKEEGIGRREEEEGRMEEEVRGREEYGGGVLGSLFFSILDVGS